jgi:centromere protein F
MSWVQDEWKDGLPHKALQKINQLEAQFERLKKEREQKQFQLDSLEQVSIHHF